jgi:hypothetical protein
VSERPPAPAGARSRNPLRSEDAAFRVLLWVAAAALAVIALALLLQAL